MKNHTSVDFAFRAVVAALAFAVHFAASAAAPAQSVTPCTFVGRLMDAEHVAFDTNRVAEIVAYTEDGKKIAASRTFFKEDSRRNYALRIPMASKPVKGMLTTGDKVVIVVVLMDGTVYDGIISDLDSVIGGPGTVKEIDIVLENCTNPYDVDDELLYDIYTAWRYSDYYVANETFDPLKDYDGDGMSTVAEVLAGTDPFDAADCLSILSYERGETKVRGVAKDAISFTCRPGRSYTVEVSDSLDNPNWKPAEFSLDESGTPVNYISIPGSGTAEETPKVYLLPMTDKKKAFYRIKAD